jgi:AraC-like DNA-binding protein
VLTNALRPQAVSLRSWSTQDVEPARALAYWVDTVGQVLLELDIDTPQRENFSARLEQGMLGPAKLNLIEASHQWMQRTRAGIARRSCSSMYLLQLRSGQFGLSQYGRECAVRAGECILIDGDEPYRLSCPERTLCVSLEFPCDWLGRWIPEPQALAARRLSTRGWGAALQRALHCLAPAQLGELALPPGVVAEQIAALLALAIGREAQSVPKLLDRLRRTLEERYHEVDLTPAAVAAQNGIGKRYLHSLFGAEGTTFNGELMAIRLERARQMLQDRRFERLPIGEVAARCGFVDPSHFARRFRTRFCMAPAAYKRNHGVTPRRACRLA